MSIDLFDKNFPSHLDVKEVQEDICNAQANIPLQHNEQNAAVARIYALVTASVISGGYDGMYLYIDAGAYDTPRVITALTDTLDAHGVIYNITGNVVNIPTKNSQITFVTSDEMVAGKYDYLAASMIVVDVDYSKKSKEFLEELLTSVTDSLDYNGKMVGFLTDFDAIPSGGSSSGRAGEFRMNDSSNQLEVYNGIKWVQLKR